MSSGDARAVLRRCDVLATHSEEPGRLTRRMATPALRAAGETVAAWMLEAGMAVRRDGVGNVVGRYAGTGAGTFALGSHLDTVRDAGRYDGALGVVAALAVVERLQARGERLPVALEVTAFADEEGVRFGTAYLGSAAYVGAFDPAWLELADASGVTLGEALQLLGDDGRAAAAAPPRDDLVGWCEAHIEQGPVLQGEDLPVGVVTTIAGQTRVGVRLAGTAGHAGTVPMAARRDALAGAAELVTSVERRASTTTGLVATVGELHVRPGASNVIPGEVLLTLDVRHADDAARSAAVATIEADAAQIAGRRGLTCRWTPTHDAPSVPCSPMLSGLLEAAVARQGLPVRRLASGAGHDAVQLARACPVAMLFVRCRDGISHNPAESVREDDVAVALDVLERFVVQAARRCGAER